ncbi:MAG TPA: PAS domain S-box protein [Chryseosolibacter sp.]
MTPALKDESRMTAIVEQVRRFAEGDYTAAPPASGTSVEVGEIALALNELGARLAARQRVYEEREKRIEKLLDILLRYTILDFSERAPIGDDGDEIDALAAGLNSLGEEVIDHIARLKEREVQVQTIFTSAPDAVIAIDRNGSVVRWNPAAARIFGWGQEETIGQPLHRFIVPERFRERHVNGIRHFLDTAEGKFVNRTVELPALCKDGREIDIEMTISTAQVSGEHLFISFLRDITRRKKAEEEVRSLNATLEQRVLERTEQLNLSEAKYRSLFENNPMPLWVLDMETLMFIDVNESALGHYGYSREEFLAMSSVDLRPEEERQRYLNLTRKPDGTENMGVWKHRKKDGSIIYAEVSAHEILFEGRKARLILSSDVTEKTRALKELQISEARFRRIFDSKMTGFLFWDASGRITEANDLFLEMVGYSRDDLREGRMHLNGMTPPEYLEADARALEQIRLHGVCDPFEKEYIRKDGTRIPVMIGAANIDDSPSVSGVTCVMDISQRKKMEEEILGLNRSLEARIAQRTLALEEVNKELESFSYSVSHDLRAPLRAIHGYSEMLQEDFGDKLDGEGERLLKNIKFNAKRMGQLVDDLLAFSRMGKRALTETETDLARIVDDVLKGLRPEEKNRARITVRPLGTARADGNLLRQAFQNLISNALKYSSKHERPEVEIGMEEVDGVTAYFVRDNGAGFDMAYYNKLFGVFQRLHGEDEFEGTGVGLAIVQRIIHRHGGKIWAEGKVGEGAVFYFTLGDTANR